MKHLFYNKYKNIINKYMKYFLTIIQVLLVILKVFNIINVSWWIVLIPTFIFASYVLLLMVSVIIWITVTLINEKLITKDDEE